MKFLHWEIPFLRKNERFSNKIIRKRSVRESNFFSCIFLAFVLCERVKEKESERERKVYENDEKLVITKKKEKRRRSEISVYLTKKKEKLDYFIANR